MTIPLTLSSLTRLRTMVAAKWGGCAGAQGIKQTSRANVGDDGNLYITVPELRMHRQSTLDAFARATESLSRIIEDEGFDVERGERDGRPTWRVAKRVRFGGKDFAEVEPWHPARVAYDHARAMERAARDAPRHAAASDTRGPKYTHHANVGKMAERSKGR